MIAPCLRLVDAFQFQYKFPVLNCCYGSKHPLNEMVHRHARLNVAAIWNNIKKQLGFIWLTGT